MSAGELALGSSAAGPRPWTTAAALSVTETVSWGVLYYAFAVFLVPMQRDLGLSAAQLSGAFSAGLLVSAGAGVLVGRHLDRHGPRALMSAGSAAGVLLVAAWSQVGSAPALYAVWLALGAVMAAVLYEPAFTVLAKAFPDAAERRRAMTAMTLVAALASVVFLPLSQALIERVGWRDALLVLAALMAVVCVPLHLAALPTGPRPAAPRGAAARTALADSTFWLLTGAFVLGAIATIAMTVHAVAFLLERGHGAGFAAFAVGLVGLAQIPGRLLFAPAARRLPRPVTAAGVFALIAAGIAVVVAVEAAWAAPAGLTLLGMGNGMATLARAAAIADLFGTSAYGTIAATAGALTTTARAVGPVLAAAVALWTSYGTLLWLLVGLSASAGALAFAAERRASRPTPGTNRPTRAA